MEINPHIVKQGSFTLSEVECEKLLFVLDQWNEEHKDSVHRQFVSRVLLALHNLRRELS